jgi:hypothetical protein
MRLKSVFNKVDIIIGLITVVCALAIILFMAWFAQDQGLDFSEISRDIISVASLHPFTGIFSNTGIIVWGIAFSALAWGAVFSIYFIQSKRIGTMFVAFGLITGLMYLDDFLLIHEMVVKYYLKLPEETMMVLYALLVVLFSFLWYKELMGKGLLLLAISFGFLGLSAGFDFVEKFITINAIHIVEDGAKFCGIMLWAAFGIRLTFTTMKEFVSANCTR